MRNKSMRNKLLLRIVNLAGLTMLLVGVGLWSIPAMLVLAGLIVSFATGELLRRQKAE